MTMSQLDVLESLEERVVPSLATRVTHARGDAAGRNTLRIALYSQDSLGLGHLRRTTHIGRRRLEAAPDSAVLLFADSPVAPLFALPDGMDCVKLPSILKVDAGRWRPTSLPILRRACHPLQNGVRGAGEGVFCGARAALRGHHVPQAGPHHRLHNVTSWLAAVGRNVAARSSKDCVREEPACLPMWS